jgi:hypothetical protein
MRMNRRTQPPTTSRVARIAALSLAALGAAWASGCELVVQLDRSLVEAGPPDIVLGVCPICTNLEDGGDDGEAGGSADAAQDAEQSK